MHENRETSETPAAQPGRRSAVETVLDVHLPESYGPRGVFNEKCNSVFDLMVDYASQGLKWVSA